MNRITTALFPSTRRLSLVAAAAAALVLAACGGGGGSSTASGPTNFAAGAITGFGSVFVNGVRFDDSSATIEGEDDSSGRSDDLRVGMQVEVQSDDVVCTTDSAGVQTCTAKARHISHGGNSLVGPIDTGSLVAGTSFSLLGQKITIGTATTISFDSSGLTALGEGAIVEVHGSFDKTTGETAATRIEVKAANLAAFFSGDPAADSDRYRLRGVLANLDTTARTATIGGQPVHFGNDARTGAPIDLSTLANDQVLRVRIVPKASADATSPWEVDRVKNTRRNLDAFKGNRAELEGTITDTVITFDTVNTSVIASVSFKIDGSAVTVAATGVRFDDDTTLADLVDGARVEVEGTVDATTGVLVATKVELKHGKGGHHDKVQGFEYHGVPGAYDATANTFTLRGETIAVTDTTEFLRGLTKDILIAGTTRKIEVKGVRSADGTQVNALTIKFDN